MKENSEIIFKYSLPVFILLGLAEITAYYKQFNFPILEYLSISEILNAFLINLHIYCALFMQFAIVFIIDNKHFRGSLTLVLIALILINVFNFLVSDSRFQTSSDILTVLSFIILFGAFFLYISKKSVFQYLNSLEKINPKLIISLFTFLTLLVISSFQGKFSATIVKNKHIYTGTSIFRKLDLIVSNDTNYYIGKTNSYVFFFNVKKQNVEVYPLNQIDKIIYKINVSK